MLVKQLPYLFFFPMNTRQYNMAGMFIRQLHHAVTKVRIYHKVSSCKSTLASSLLKMVDNSGCLALVDDIDGVNWLISLLVTLQLTIDDGQRTTDHRQTLTPHYSRFTTHHSRFTFRCLE